MCSHVTVHAKVVPTKRSSAFDGLFVIVITCKDGKKQMVLFKFPIHTHVDVCKSYIVIRNEKVFHDRLGILVKPSVI